MVTGAIIATCFQLSTALKVALTASSVFQNQTSHTKSRSIGLSFSISCLMSTIALDCHGVNSYGNDFSNSTCVSESSKNFGLTAASLFA